MCLNSSGFDVVIGNPPYLNIKNVDRDMYSYLEKKYAEIHTGYNDIMYYFVYTGIKVLKEKGIYGCITSNYYLSNTYARLLRKFLKNHCEKIVNFKGYLVFSQANVHTNIIITVRNSKSREIAYYEKLNDSTINHIDCNANFKAIKLDKSQLGEYWILADKLSMSIINKVNSESLYLDSISIIGKGQTSGKNRVFTIPYSLAIERKFEREILRKNVKNGDIDRYTLNERGNFLIYVDKNTNISDYPNIYMYLKEHKKELENRNGVKRGLHSWYRLESPRRKEIFDVKEKLIVPYRAECNKFAYDNRCFFNDSGDIRIIVLKSNTSIALKYILGILNSKLINWYYGYAGKPKGGLREYTNEPISRIPIKPIDFSNLSEKTQHDRMVNLVNQMLDVQKELSAKVVDEKPLQQKVDTVDKQIDTLVYELYGLTDEEIKIVEGKNNGK